MMQWSFPETHYAFELYCVFAMTRKPLLDFFKSCNGGKKDLAVEFLSFCAPNLPRNMCSTFRRVAKFNENDEPLVSFLKMHYHDESNELSSFVSIAAVMLAVINEYGRQVRPICNVRNK
jgi:hypothetical protein